MADFFGAIAANDIRNEREALVFPSPVPKNGKVFTLSPFDGAPLAVPKKMSTKEELDAQIEALREKYMPFMQQLAPKTQSTRKRQDIREFDIREAQEADFRDFSGVLAGKGEWEKITVPYYNAPVGYAAVFYRTAFTASRPADGRALFLHFDGVDYIADVYINGAFVGTHEGFFDAFEYDITPYINDGENTLLVTVKNDFIYGGNPSPTGTARFEGDKMYAATGPGYDDFAFGWHHCPAGCGIYQKVYLEERERAFISDIFVRPLPETDEFEVFCEVFNCDHAPLQNVTLSFSVNGENFEENVLSDFVFTPITYENEDRGEIIFADKLEENAKTKNVMPLNFHRGENLVRLRFRAPNMRRWTLDEPYLYSVEIKLYENDILRDIKAQSFGMRSFIQDNMSTPAGMFYLNGKPIRLRGANTMGYEQQDVMNGDLDALLYDMLMAKACGMNFLRITQRPVQPEIYELCDKIGLMIQTDLPLFTVMRRTRFAFGIEQAEKMERLIRSHPCCIMISYINEPMANANNRPHRHLVRDELDMFFSSLDSAVKILNPDRVIKHIDGDYDPPDSTLPDNHCYTTWYNGHGIDIGKLHRGYWLGVRANTYYACGEYGAEGLDTADLMRRRYPAEWLPKEDESIWSPADIKDAQSGNMHYFFYDTQKTLEDWVSESRKYQALATKIQTEAFRRDAGMASFAIHLFIDAWPAGWMKTIVDCERLPKPAFYAYRDALTPLMLSIRSDRKAVFAGEEFSTELFVCNDTDIVSDAHKIIAELISESGKAVAKAAFEADFGANSSFMQGELRFIAPEISERESFTLRATLLDKNGTVVHYSEEEIAVFPKEALTGGDALYIAYEEYAKGREIYDEQVKNGRTLIINALPAGTHSIADKEIKAKPCGMRALHFVSRNTGHDTVKGFTPYDFRYWYSEKDDMITPLLRFTFTGEGLTPILLSGNSLSGSAWGKKLYPAYACAEFAYGKGKIIINEVELDEHISNPVAAIFKNRLLRS